MVLAGQVHRSNAEELESLPCDLALGEKSVHYVNSNEEGFRTNSESHVQMDEPVNEHTAHPLIQILLGPNSFHIGLELTAVFSLAHPTVNVVCIAHVGIGPLPEGFLTGLVLL